MSASCNSEDVLARRHFRALDELAHLDVIVDPYAAAIAWAREQAESAAEADARIVEIEGERDEALEDVKSAQKERDEANAENDELLAQVKQLEKEVCALERTAARLEAEIAEVRLERDVARDLLTEARLERDAHKAERDIARQEIEAMRGIIQRTQA